MAVRERIRGEVIPAGAEQISRHGHHHPYRVFRQGDRPGRVRMAGHNFSAGKNLHIHVPINEINIAVAGFD